MAFLVFIYTYIMYTRIFFSYVILNSQVYTYLCKYTRSSGCRAAAAVFFTIYKHIHEVGHGIFPHHHKRKINVIIHFVYISIMCIYYILSILSKDRLDSRELSNSRLYYSGICLVPCSVIRDPYTWVLPGLNCLLLMIHKISPICCILLYII